MSQNEKQNPLGSYFKEVEAYSEQHRKDMERIEHLLESIKNSLVNDMERTAFKALKNSLKKFDAYLRRNRIILEDFEKREILSISNSGYSPIIKKRLMEDLIYKIKKRYSEKVKKRIEESEIKNEIKELSVSALWIVDWFRLTKFAIAFGTITVFTHQLKDSVLSIIREKVAAWLEIIIKNIKPLLDREYYLFNSIEYNSLEIILHLDEPVAQISEIEWKYSYNPAAIQNQIDKFAAVYLKILKNSEHITAAFNKVYKKRKPAHGLWGAFKSLLDQPVFENKPVPMSEYDRMSKTVTGMLLSYYTSREGVVVRTINQIIYLTASDVKIDYNKKLLTAEAVKREKKIRESENSEFALLSGRYRDICRISGRFLKKGCELEERIHLIENKKNYSSFKSQIKNKPLLRIIKLVEGFIRHYVNLITAKSDFVLVYDSAEFNDYFRIKPEIIETANKYNFASFNLTGAKIRELEGITITGGENSAEFIKILTDSASKIRINPKMSLARTVLVDIAEMSYRLGTKLNEMIAHYYNRKKIIYPEIEKNYDFFINARLKKSRKIAIHSILEKNSISLSDFLESACALAFHISDILNHPGLQAILKEKDRLKIKIKEIISKYKSDDEFDFDLEGLDLAEAENDDRVVDEIDSMYRDALTGFWKFEYLKDQVLSRLYDSNCNYRLDIPRFVFVCNIPGFEQINYAYGHDTGDALLLQVSKVLNERINIPDMRSNDILVKYSNGYILGYMNDTALTSVVDRLLSVSRELRDISFKADSSEIGKIIVNFGIYQERKGSNFYNNINIAKKILSAANRDERGSVAFVKDQNRIITDKDFDRFDEINRDIITVVD